MFEDDIQTIMFSADEIAAKVKEIGENITCDYKLMTEDIFCVGILKGAVMFYTDLVRQIKTNVKFDFMVASSYGSGTKSSGAVKILKDLDYDVAGKHMILIEDIVDTGITMEYLLKYCRGRGAKSVKICSLLNKPSRRVADITIDYVGFTVPDEFLVGYGLDYDGNYRNLPYIGVLKPDI